MAAHTPAICNCSEHYCYICAGGLVVCAVCGGISDGTLPTECPGRPMTHKQTKAILECRLDFINGIWKILGQPF